MGLVHTSRNHSEVQLMISRILRYAKTQKELNQPATIFVTKNTTESYHIDYLKDVLERNGFIVSLSEGYNHINVDISW